MSGAGKTTVGQLLAEALGAEFAEGDAAAKLRAALVVPELAARVFTKFWRGNRRPGGTGLGLYIARGLVEAHGGTIEVHSEVGRGTLFRLVFPAGAATEPAA